MGQRTEDEAVVTIGNAGGAGRGATCVRASLPFLPVLLLAAAIVYDCLTPADFTAAPCSPPPPWSPRSSIRCAAPS